MVPTGENRSTRRKVCPSAAELTTDLTLAGPGSDLGLTLYRISRPIRRVFCPKNVPIILRLNAGMSNCRESLPAPSLSVLASYGAGHTACRDAVSTSQ